MVALQPQIKSHRAQKLLGLATALLLPGAAALADSYWQGGTSDFNNPASWNNGYVPIVSSPQNNADNDSGSNNVCLIQPGDPVWGPWDIRAGDGPNASGSFLQTGGTVNVGGWFRLADGVGSAGYYTLSNGVVNCALQAHVGELGNAVLEIDGGTFNVAGDPFALGDTDINAGANPTGVLKMNGGTITTATGVELWLGEGNSGRVGTGTMLMTGGTVNIGSWFAIGRFGGIGDLELSGGSITMAPGNNGNITLATTPGTGLVNQSGGSLTNTLTQTWVAESNLGTWNLNGGWDVLGVIHLTQNGGAQGTFNLNGGNLVATEITDNGGNGTFNFNGGTLHAGATTANFVHDVNGGVTVQAGGANINTEGNNATISQALADGGGGLVKLGAGTLTLSGANTYSGPTVVSNGILTTTTASSANGNYTVEDNAGFGVVVASAGAQLTPAAVTLGNTAGPSLYFDMGAFGTPTGNPAPLNVTTLTANGTTVVNVADELPQVGQFHLIQYSSLTGSGTFTLGTLPAGVQAHLVGPTGGYLDLDITQVGSDDWDGLAGGNWDLGVTTNWVNASSLLPTVFNNGDAVTFDDTAMGTTNVNLVSIVRPGSLTFNNSVLDYTLAGNGVITGACSLVVKGAAMVAILNTNGYTGPTILDNGTLVVSNLANGGVASAIGASSANPTNLVLNGGMLSYAGPAVTINRGYSLQYNYGINGGAGVNTNTGALDLVGNLTLTGPVTAAAGTSFVKTSPGTLTYAGAGTNQLSGGNDPGYQIMAGTVVFDGSAGTQVNHNQNEFYVGDTLNSGANLVLTNTTLNVDSWFCIGRGQGPNGYTSTATLYNSTLNCANFSLGYWNGRSGNTCTQVFTMNNSHLVSAGAFNLCESAGSIGYMYINGNSLVNENGPFIPGMQSGAACTVVMSGSSILTNNLWASIGANGAGTLIMSNNTLFAENSDFNLGDYGASGTSGTFDIQDNAQVVMIGTGNGVYVGKTAGAIGLVNQLGGTINARSCGVFQLAQQSSSTGTWYQSGGTNYAGGWVSIGRGANAGDTTPTGLLLVSGGLFDQTSTGNGLIVGEQGTGTLVVSNTGVVISEANNIGVAIGWNGGVGEVDLDGGGTLIANFIQQGSGTATFNFNGGLLKAGANTRLNFMSGLTTATILSGANIDTGTNTIAIAQPLLNGGAGGLTKIGNGSLLLDGANTYTGTTTISAGTLGGSGTIAGPVVIGAGATLSPGDSTIGTLTLGSSLSLASTSATIMELNKTNSTNDSVTGASSITYGGTLVLKKVSGMLQVGDSFTLFAAGSYSGSFANIVSQTPGQTVSWDLSQLNVNGSVKVAGVAATPASLTPAIIGGNLSLVWPANQIGYQLQEQTNSLAVGLGTNWVAVPGSASTNQVSLPAGQSAGSVLFRLKF